MDDTRPTVHERDTERAKLGAALPAYDIGAVLGRGAFAVVYAARHRHLEREVAIKRLSPEMLREAEARGRFAAEARLLASLDHPHIVRVYDYVEEEDVCAFVMERMDGGNLAERLAKGPVERGWACAVMLASLHGLEAAHRKGVLHRDVKPENLLFDEGSQVKVADFGIAKVVGAQGARLTATAAAIGTPAYMAPEQVTRNAGPLSSATDVWSSAAVLYEMVAGRPPYPLTGELADVLLQRVTDEACPIQEAAPDVPGELAEVIMRALARDPAERYQTPGAFAAELEPAAQRTTEGGLATTGVPIHRTSPADGARALVEAPAVPPTPARPRPRRRGWLIAAAVGAVAAVAGVLAVALGGSGAGSAEALPPPPRGWPPKLTAAFVDQVQGVTGEARRLGKDGTSYTVYYGDAAVRQDWSHDKIQEPPGQFVTRISKAGQYPYMAFYSLRQLGQSKKGGDADAVELRRTLQSPKLMHTYWLNVRKFLKAVGSAKRYAAVSLDSNVWSPLEQNLADNGGRPTSISARVALSGLPELENVPDNLLGVAQGWSELRNRYAPKVALGYQFDDYAAGGVDISRDDPPEQTVVDAGRATGEFFANTVANQMDFAALTIDGDGKQEGQNPNPQANYSTSEKRKVVTFVREFVRVAHAPVVLEGVPMGNTARRAITDKKFHWRDSWVQWLLGDDTFSGMRAMHDAGVIGVLFGTGYAEGETCACDAAADKVTNDGRFGTKSTSADDDGGYFADRIAALNKAGGFPLAQEG